jgi:hypothetical protein
VSAPTRRALLAGASAAVALPAAAPIVAQAAPATLQMPNTPYEMLRLLCP